MPFLYRNFKGEITGYSTTKQEDTADFVPDDDPAFLEFIARNPPPPPPPEPSQEEMAEANRQVAERHKLLSATQNFSSRFSNGLELSLSSLLNVIVDRPKSKVAFAIYHSPTGFDARVEIVENALLEIISEDKSALGPLAALWPLIRKKIDRCRNLRNAIAHGSFVTHITASGTPHLRLSPPVFDAIRVGRVLTKRQIPGLSANDIETGARQLLWAMHRVDEVNRLLVARRSDIAALPDRFLELEAGLKKPDNPL